MVRNLNEGKASRVSAVSILDGRQRGNFYLWNDGNYYKEDVNRLVRRLGSYVCDSMLVMFIFDMIIGYSNVMSVAER